MVQGEVALYVLQQVIAFVAEQEDAVTTDYREEAGRRSQLLGQVDSSNCAGCRVQVPYSKESEDRRGVIS